MVRQRYDRPPAPEPKEPEKKPKPKSRLSLIEEFTYPVTLSRDSRRGPPLPDRRTLIKRMAMVGNTEDDICKVLGLTKKQLGPYTPILRFGQAMMRATIRRMQFIKCLKGDSSMLIFLGKNLLGQMNEPGSPEEAEGLLQQLFDAIKESPDT